MGGGAAQTWMAQTLQQICLCSCHQVTYGGMDTLDDPECNFGDHTYYFGDHTDWLDMDVSRVCG